MNKIYRFLFGKTRDPITLARSAEDPACTNCATPVIGPYCSQCGQKKEHKHDFTIWHFIAHSLHEFIHLDSRFYKTVKYLLFKPGYLTEEYIVGHRKRYINPVRLFLIINILYLLVTGVDTFTTPLEVHMEDRYRNIVRPLVASKLKQTGLSFEEYARQFDEKTKGLAETMLVLMVFAFSVVMSILYYRQRRYFLEHVIFSFNFYSFILILVGVGFFLFNVLVAGVLLAVEKIKIATHHISVPAANQEIKDVFSFIGSDFFLTFFLGSIVIVMLFASLKRVYGESNFATCIKAILGYISIWYIMLGYRLILFFTTYYMLHVH